MNEDAKNQLNAILGSYDDKLAETERRDAAIRAAQESFPDRFATLKAKTLRPALASHKFICPLGPSTDHEHSLQPLAAVSHPRRVERDSALLSFHRTRE